MTEQRKRKTGGVNGFAGSTPRFVSLIADASQKSKSAPWGALDAEDHWWLPPSHVRADLRKSLPSAVWQRAVLLISILLLTFVLSELVGTILEAVYPPSTSEEKFFFGIILFGSDAVGGLANLFFGFELWFWTLAFGWGWWANLDHLLEATIFVADLVLRMHYSGPPEVGRCLHLIVST